MAVIDNLDKVDGKPVPYGDSDPVVYDGDDGERTSNAHTVVETESGSGGRKQS